MELRSQFQRASASIALNLAEGYGRTSNPDRRKFYGIAFGAFENAKPLLS